MKIYWSILTSKGYPTKEDKLREEEEYLRQLEKIRLMLGAEKESNKREEEFEVLVDSIKRLYETVSIKRADCEEQIENAKAKIEAAREEYERVTETGKKIIDCNMSIIEEFKCAQRETLEELLGIFYKHNGDFTEKELKELVDSIKRLYETVSIKRADCEEQIENAKAKIEAAREEYERVTETGKKIIDCNMSIIEEFKCAQRETLEELLGIFYKHNGDFTEKELKELENLTMK